MDVHLPTGVPNKYFHSFWRDYIEAYTYIRMAGSKYSSYFSYGKTGKLTFTNVLNTTVTFFRCEFVKSLKFCFIFCRLCHCDKICLSKKFYPPLPGVPINLQGAVCIDYGTQCFLQLSDRTATEKSPSWGHFGIHKHDWWHKDGDSAWEIPSATGKLMTVWIFFVPLMVLPLLRQIHITFHSWTEAQTLVQPYTNTKTQPQTRSSAILVQIFWSLLSEMKKHKHAKDLLKLVILSRSPIFHTEGVTERKVIISQYMTTTVRQT